MTLIKQKSGIFQIRFMVDGKTFQKSSQSKNKAKQTELVKKIAEDLQILKLDKRNKTVQQSVKKNLKDKRRSTIKTCFRTKKLGNETYIFGISIKFWVLSLFQNCKNRKKNFSIPDPLVESLQTK